MVLAHGAAVRIRTHASRRPRPTAARHVRAKTGRRARRGGPIWPSSRGGSGSVGRAMRKHHRTTIFKMDETIVGADEATLVSTRLFLSFLPPPLPTKRSLVPFDLLRSTVDGKNVASKAAHGSSRADRHRAPPLPPSAMLRPRSARRGEAFLARIYCKCLARDRRLNIELGGEGMPNRCSCMCLPKS